MVRMHETHLSAAEHAGQLEGCVIHLTEPRQPHSLAFRVTELSDPGSRTKKLRWRDPVTIVTVPVTDQS
jgi:hypothetical protein